MNVLDKFSLNKKVAVVTGGAGHLGAAMAEALNDAGAKVVVLDLNEELFNQNFSAKTNFYYIHGDISNTESIKNGYNEIINQFGRIDVLINNAIYLKGGGCLPEDIDDEMWSISAEGVAGSVFRCIREVIPFMKKTQGSIVNIASMYGVIAPDLSMYDDVCSPYLNPINYGAFKASVIQITKYFGAYLIPEGINVNCITPGAFPSPKVQKNEEFIKRLMEKTPSKRIGTPDDLKGVVLFLSSKASDYIVGQNIIVDGGWTLW